MRVTDSVFAEINKLCPEKIDYGLYKDSNNVINIDFKNKYEKSLGFIAGYSDSKLFLEKREDIPKEKVLSYESFNDLLNEEFLKIYFYCKYTLSYRRTDTTI